MRMAILSSALIVAGAASAGEADLEAQAGRAGVVPAVHTRSLSPLGGPHLTPLPAQFGHWHFVGCVHSHHACAHQAHGHGFHHHRAVHNHHVCHHHPHLACYGR